MKEYLITLVETLEYKTTIIADSMEDAENKLNEILDNGGDVFINSDCVDTEIFITEQK